MGRLSVARGAALRHTGRIRIALLAFLGALAVATMVGLIVLFATRKSEVDQLVDILCGPNTSDVAWAFEELKVVSDDSLPELLSYISSERLTPLHDLHWEDGVAAGSMGGGTEALQVGRVARFILLCRLGMLGEHGEWAREAPQRDRAAWENDLERLRRIHTRPDGRPLPVYPQKRKLIQTSEVRPPSRDSRLIAMAAGGDVDGLVEILKSGSKAEAGWALEVLRTLPDETIEKLMPLAVSNEPTRVCRFPWSLGSSGSSQGFQVGKVVYFLLWSRTGRNDHERLTTTSRPLSLDALQELEAAWKEYRERKVSR